MSEHNVYAAPKSWGHEVTNTSGCRRDGKYVLVPVGSDLPHRCIICNAPAVTPIKKRKVYWHHPAWYLLIPLNILLYAVIGLIVRKKAEVSPGLCQEHHDKRKKKLIVLPILAVLALFAWAFAMPQDSGLFVAILPVAFFVILIAVVIASQLVVATKISTTDIKLKGCKEPFLASIEVEKQG